MMKRFIIGIVVVGLAMGGLVFYQRSRGGPLPSAPKQQQNDPYKDITIPNR